MKNMLLILLVCFLVPSCSNNKSSPAEDDADTAEIAEARMIWQAGLNDSTGRLQMNLVPAGEPGLADLPSVIEYINRTNPSIIVSVLRTSNDTVYLKIDDAEYLTQRMGSAGPMTYLAGLVFNLTELAGIRYVNLDFEEGDHASPGIFTKETFRNE